jgi:hypothetical protein
VQEHEKALNSIAVYIRMNPETMEGMQLRKFLWSLYDSQELINLMRFYGRLPLGIRNLVQTVNDAAISGILQRTDLHRALVVSGEFRRREFARASEESINHFADVEATMVMLARTLPPCKGSQCIGQLLENFEEVKRVLLIEQNKPARPETDPDEGCPF